jgi:hypothetical protein
VRLPGTPRYLAGGYRTRELARVFRSSHRQPGHSVAHEQVDARCCETFQLLLCALVKSMSSVNKHCEKLIN